MDMDALRKCSISVQKPSRCLNSLFELISIFDDSQQFAFSKHAFSEFDLKKRMHVLFMLPKNVGTKFKIQKKVLTAC